LIGIRLPDTNALMADNGEILDFLRARVSVISTIASAVSTRSSTRSLPD
jgi:hypothetical protein